MKHARALKLNFAPAPNRPTPAGLMLCAIGLALAVTVGIALRAAIAERQQLEGAIEALATNRRAPIDAPERNAEQAEIAKMTRALTIPWTPLLAELEAASNEMPAKVSLLQVEPDPEKHLVHITAEVHALPDALAYLQRLQKSPLLRYPMLESHERQKNDPEHAVRVKIEAEWRS